MPSLNDLWVELTRLRSLIGLGGTTLTANGVLYAGTGAVLATSQGPANSVLTANAGAPSFSATPVIGTSLGIDVTPVTDAKLQVNGHIHSTGTTLTIASCTGGSVAAGSTDQAGQVTMGPGLTSCTFNFGTAWANAPWCTVGPSTLDNYQISATTTVLTVGASVAARTVKYICMGRG